MGDEVTGQSSVELTVDGEHRTITYREGSSLMQALRDNRIDSVLNGCSEGVCGACNVLNEDTGGVVRSCLFPADRFDGAELTTAAGLVDDETGELHPVQAAFLDHGAAQCGFCIPGMMVSAAKLLRENDDPTREEIASALNGNICRCTGYVQQFDAVEDAAARIRGETETSEQSSAVTDGGCPGCDCGFGGESDE
ncbi:(2Fe-2S)-binding protein [Halogeometricum luteum]|uniref:2Fe-2S iron-sulfur cluster-binding protein n=1 Tax=Halogeometricum luteum TaxID=2950537 RepID=A0ABU2G2A1_9EURY|nr:2Fe-2S iron-sulfur cluster-binding protein [Halogeometricum sp. S3BR5-2]MDS0294902.1 2Fe-2S iron-sulfur cluster-binding protein [Halogeometricum sp. S3BR5-2]